MCILKHVVRYAVIAGLVGGTAALVAGPERMGALITQTRGKVNAVIDANIEDPVALRSQMRSLEGEYPQRIAEVRGDLSELQAQKGQLQRELSVSDRVVSLASTDMEQMRELIARGESAQAEARASGAERIVRVVFSNEKIDLDDAYGKATRIGQVQQAYANRAADIQRDLGYVGQQEERLVALLGQLESEHAEFQAQLWQMDRQVDTIARNERLIAMMEKRQRTIDDQSRYGAHSLDQLAARFADIRAKQEAQLESLGTSGQTANYEDRAKFDLDAKGVYERSEAERATTVIKPSPTVIEITPEGGAGGSRLEGPKPLAKAF